jgi:hypothetical protein
VRVFARLDRAIQTPKNRFVERHYIYRLVLFFAVAYATTWIPWSAAAWASQRGLKAYAVLFNHGAIHREQTMKHWPRAWKARCSSR